MIADEEMAMMANAPINVPDMPDTVAFIGAAEEQEMRDEMRLAELASMRAKLGDAALTEDERIWLAAEEAKADRPAPKTDHYANLAEYLSDNDLAGLASDVIQWVKWDLESRADWFKKEKEGIQRLGLTSHKDKSVIPNGSTAHHPALAEACVQFASRSLDQMWPAAGPVRTAIAGKKTEENMARSRRVAAHMNFQYDEGLPEAFDQTDKMLIRLPLSGSMFTKTYEDPVEGRCREVVEPQNFVVPYRADSLRTTPRYTEIMPLSDNIVRKRQVAGYYRKIDLKTPREDTEVSDREGVRERVKETEGMSEAGHGFIDHRRTIYMCNCELNLKGFEDTDEFGRQTGVKLPYVVHVDRTDQKVLAIFRGWEKGDPKKKREIIYTHYKFLPGLGFYGYGMYHWIAGLSIATTGSLRALLDAAAFANMRGGYRAKDAGIRPGDDTIEPGKYKEIDTDMDDLRKAFFNIDFKEPSGVLFQLMLAMQEMAQRFVGSTDALVGSGDKNTPVGTMLARIEQGSKVMTTVHKRLHRAAKYEFGLMAKLNRKYLFAPGARDPMQFEYQDGIWLVYPGDYDDITVKPVSDPNFISNAHRHFVTQAQLEMAATAPQLYNLYELHKRAHIALKAEDYDEFLIDPADRVTRLDPVTENALTMTNRPIQVFPEQAHDAHIMVHQQVLANLPPADPTAQVLNAHIQEHLAHQYLLQMSQMTGVDFVFPGPDTPDDEEAPPPEVEIEVSMMAAEVAEQMMQAQQNQEPPPDPAMVKAEAEIRRKDAVAQADINRKNQVAAADIERKTGAVAADQVRKDATMVSEGLRAQAEAEQRMALSEKQSQANAGEKRNPEGKNG